MIARSITILLTILLVGCARHRPPLKVQVAGPPTRSDTLRQPPEITSESEADFHDFVFLAEAKNVEAAGKLTRYIRARGTYKGKPVEFIFVWGAKNEWKPLKVAKLPRPLYQDAGLFLSRGSASNTIMEALSEEYGVKPRAEKMAKAVTVTIISLEGDPRFPEKEAVKSKLFFSEKSEKDYGELFLNLDLPHARLVLAEKDAGYRGGVVRSLSGAKGK